MKEYRVTVTRVTEYRVTASSEQEVIDFAVDESPEAEAQSGADDAVAVEIVK